MARPVPAISGDIPAFRDSRLAAVLLDALPGLVACFDRELRYVYANDTYRRWRSLVPEQVIGRACREIVGDAHYPAIAERLSRALAGETVNAEYTLFDGEHERRVQGSYLPHRDDSGAIIGVVALVTPLSQRPDLQARIAESEAMFDDAFENAPIGMAVTAVTGRMLRVNAAFAAMLDRDVADMQGADFRTITHPGDIDADMSRFKAVLAGRRNGYRMEKRFLRGNGEPVHTVLSVSAVRGADGQVLRFVAQIEDIGERRRAEARLIEANTHLSLAMETIQGGFWHIDVATGTLSIADPLARFAGGPETLGMSGETYGDRIHPVDRPASDENLRKLVAGEIDRASVEYRLRTFVGERWIRCDRRLVRDGHGKPKQVIGVSLDITAQRERQHRAEEQAETDSLTGLLNRRGLARRLELLDAATAIGVIAIDLDAFKAINDRFGHDAGDAVLVATARRLRAAVRASDMIVRFGGDEFGLILPGIDRYTLDRLTAEIGAALGRPIEHGTLMLPVAASVGTAQGQGPIAELLAEADRALYAAKETGRGQVAWPRSA